MGTTTPGVAQPPVRIVDLPPAGLIDGSEQIEAVQKGASVRVLLSTLFSSGDSAYQVAVKQGFQGTVTAWLASLVGAKGDQGLQGLQGLQGIQGDRGLQGVEGLSAYEVATANGFVGTQSDWLLSLKGAAGTNGTNGTNGKSAYELAAQQGYQYDLTTWLASLKGVDGAAGPSGLSAYQVAQGQGYAGSVTAWLASLVGAKGDQGVQGNPGTAGAAGATWYLGTGAPAAALGVLSDNYLDKATATIYTKTSGGWAAQGVLSSAAKQSLPIACSDETTSLSVGASKVVFRMPYGMTLNALKASLSTAQVSGAIFTIDVKVNGTSILTTKLTLDNTARTSKGASTPYVFSSAFGLVNNALNEDDEVTIDIVQIGDGTAKGLKVYLNGTFI